MRHLEILQDESFNGNWEVAKSILHEGQVPHDITHHIVEVLQVEL